MDCRDDKLVSEIGSSFKLIILVSQCRWNVCETPGVDALFSLTVHHSGESVQTRPHRHALHDRQAVFPPTLDVKARRSLTWSVNTWTWISPKAADHKSHQQKGTIFPMALQLWWVWHIIWYYGYYTGVLLWGWALQHRGNKLDKKWILSYHIGIVS